MTTNTNPARGMRDFLPDQIRRREYVIKIIKEVYESYGFEPLETPSVENLETLTGKYGEEGNQLIYKILKRGEKLDRSAPENELSDLALRYDLTVPLARVVANRRNELPKFFKRYQIQPVWRADRPARGRYREFYQCDVDAIGSSSMIVEAELCAAVNDILTELEFDNFIIRVNHREILRGMLEVFDIEESNQTDALTAIDKLDKVGVEGVSKELAERGISDNSNARLTEWLKKVEDLRNSSHLDTVQWNERIRSELSFLANHYQNKNIFKGLDELMSVINYAAASTAINKIKFDPTLARGLSYYTGAIFEVNVPDLAGSLAGGGRYDGLIGMFGKEQIPACGFSLGLERILVVMEEREMFPKELNDSSADVLVTICDGENIEENIADSLSLANYLRKRKLRVIVYPQADKSAKQYKYADQINVPFVCELHRDEFAEDKVTLKNIRSGKRETVLREEIAAKIEAARAEMSK